MTNVTVLGLGEAGSIYALGLADAGLQVSGYDPFVSLDHPLVRQHAELADAVADADAVISLVGARVAERVALDAFAHMRTGTVYADLNTAAPALKAALEAAAQTRGVRFADVAVLAPVPRDGVRTPLMVSGDGAAPACEMLAAVGVPVESIGGVAGDAAARKLLRSVFMKGLAAVVIESVGAAEQAGCADWLRGQIVTELAGNADALIQRLIDGSKQHAGRRAHEVEDAKAYLHSLGRPAFASTAAYQWFQELLSDETANVGERIGK